MLRCGEQPCLFATIVANAKLMLDITALGQRIRPFLILKLDHKGKKLQILQSPFMNDPLTEPVGRM
jgi:hypothetical protein